MIVDISGSQIIKLRKYLDWCTQAALAKRLEVSRRTVIRWEQKGVIGWASKFGYGSRDRSLYLLWELIKEQEVTETRSSVTTPGQVTMQDLEDIGGTNGH